MDFTRNDPRSLQTRLSVFVSERMSAKQLARAIDSDVRTAENIRRGYWPQAKHWRGIVRAFGHDVLDAVFNPEIDEVEARLAEEERHAREVYIAARARREASCRARPSSSDPLLPFDE